jgi:DNA-directed RNA polymerase subunit RPC12/RpoP
MSDHLDPGRGTEIRGDLVCVLCGRTAGTVQGPNVRHGSSMSLHVQDPGHLESVRRLRCPHCSGRLWLQNSEEARRRRRPLTYEERHPPGGRRPRLGEAS